MKIEKLTDEQIKEIPLFVKKWVDIGLNCDPVDKKKAIEISDFYCEKIAKRNKAPVVVLPSPLSAWLAACMFSDQFDAQVYDQVRDQVRDQVAQVAQVGDQVYNQVRDQVAQVGDQVRDQVDAQVAQVDAQVAQVGDQVYNQVRDQVAQVDAQVYNQVRDQVRAFVWPYIDGHWWSGYLAYISYYEYLGLKFVNTDKIRWFLSLKDIGLFYPLKNIIIISDKPEKIIKNDLGLHSQNGPAVLYRDGFCVYALNGIRVPKWLVETKSDALKAEDLKRKELENVDVRREFIRKIGIDRLCEHGKVLDSWGNYELIDMKTVLSLDGPAPYLKMKNPSVDLYHLEGVHENCKTVHHALAWRNGMESYKEPIKLT
jgi:hypothetical protein